ncbi:MAG: phosphatidylserine decarboxylase family protein [Rhodobiaceae bacterium]|nr:phosphatidylserine decarboxylase family protein [Rhodobiaceae bacterium]|tara:strand:- start:1186 stop:1842 length:657 start_codon:yes stop_codon:yes gene_type:complete
MNNFIKILNIIHREGWKFSAISLLISILLAVSVPQLSLFGFLITFFILWFFRDPDRNTQNEEGKIISPADGKVCLIDSSIPPKELNYGNDEMLRVCIFMNVFNVHVNRSPIKGKIKKIEYKQGSFFNASLDKASEKNERNSIIISTENGIEVIVVQIAGLIARRILSFVNDGDHLKSGERFGLIRFGSRVDVYLPKTFKSEIKVGDKTIAGETIIGSF